MVGIVGAGGIGGTPVRRVPALRLRLRLRHRSPPSSRSSWPAEVLTVQVKKVFKA